MRKKNFTIKEDEYIRAHFCKLSLNEMAIALNRSKSGIQGRVKALGLRDSSTEAQKTFEQIKSDKGDLMNDRDSDTLRRLVELRDLLHRTLFDKETPSTALPRLASEYRNTLEGIHDLAETEDGESESSKLEELFAEFDAN